MAKKKNYLNNSNLLEQIKISQEVQKNNPNLNPSECLTPELVKMLMILVEQYSTKGNWRSYTYLSDMKGDALLALAQGALKFDGERTQNPFGYLTQFVTNAFLTVLEQERKVRDGRDDILEKNGLNPSHTRQLKNEAQSIYSSEKRFYGVDTGKHYIREFEIDLPNNLECWSPFRQAITTVMIIKDTSIEPKPRVKNKGRRVECVIPKELIEKHFDGDGEIELLETFRKHRRAIHSIILETLDSPKFNLALQDEPLIIDDDDVHRFWPHS